MTVVDDVETAVELLLDDFGDRAAYAVDEGGVIDGLTADLRRVHLL